MRTLPAGKEVTSIQHQLVRLGRNVGSIFLNTIFFAMSIPSEKLGDTAELGVWKVSLWLFQFACKEQSEHPKAAG